MSADAFHCLFYFTSGGNVWPSIAGTSKATREIGWCIWRESTDDWSSWYVWCALSQERKGWEPRECPRRSWTGLLELDLEQLDGADEQAARNERLGGGEEVLLRGLGEQYGRDGRVGGDDWSWLIWGSTFTVSKGWPAAAPPMQHAMNSLWVRYFGIPIPDGEYSSIPVPEEIFSKHQYFLPDGYYLSKIRIPVSTPVLLPLCSLYRSQSKSIYIDQSRIRKLRLLLPIEQRKFWNR